MRWLISSSSSLVNTSVLTCKFAQKCLNVCKRVEVVEWNRKMSPPFPGSPLLKESLDREKKTINAFSTKSDNILLMGDFNLTIKNKHLEKDFI